jgi:hypothetical protein
MPTDLKSALPAPTRGRRLWRWTRKWGKRVLLSLLVIVLITTSAYLIYRQFAFPSSAKELAAVRAELDNSDPDWRYEKIEEKYTAQIPPKGHNSFELLDRIPKPRFPVEIQVGDVKGLDFTKPDRAAPLTNLLPWAESLAKMEVFTADISHQNANVAMLALSPARGGAAPMVNALLLKDPVWTNFGNLSTTIENLEYAATATAARKDSAATIVYARAALNAGRSIGEMPRIIAQVKRAGAATSATRIAGRLLAWSEPKEDLEDLQREFLAEASRDWLEAAVRGERAVLAKTADQLTGEAEVRFLLTMAQKDRVGFSTQDRVLLYFSRPYKDASAAYHLRKTNRAIAHCSQPEYERLDALIALEKETPSRPTVFHRFWDVDFRVYFGAAARLDCVSKARLRTAAVAIACERFRRLNGSWPVSLSSIPREILPSLPIDPFDGKPLRYKRLKDGVVVYSVGLNRQDDNGELDDSSRGAPDVGMRLWNPEVRGLPESLDGK